MPGLPLAYFLPGIRCHPACLQLRVLQFRENRAAAGYLRLVRAQQFGLRAWVGAVCGRVDPVNKPSIDHAEIFRKVLDGILVEPEFLRLWLAFAGAGFGFLVHIFLFGFDVVVSAGSRFERAVIVPLWS